MEATSVILREPLSTQGDWYKVRKVGVQIVIEQCRLGCCNHEQTLISAQRDISP